MCIRDRSTLSRQSDTVIYGVKGKKTSGISGTREFHVFNTMCALTLFLDRSSISKILHHISFLLVNLGFTMPIKLYWNKKLRQNTIYFKIRWGTMFWSGTFFRRKFIIFLFWCVNSIVHLNSYFPCRLHRGLLCFVKCFMVIPNYLLNQLLWMLWPYCDKYGAFIVNVLKIIAPILAWISYIFWDILKFASWTPTFYFIFWKDKGTLAILLKFSESLIVKYFLLLAKL